MPNEQNEKLPGDGESDIRDGGATTFASLSPSLGRNERNLSASEPWKGRLLGPGDRDQLIKGLRASTAYGGLRILAVCLTVVGGLILVLGIIDLVVMSRHAEGAEGARGIFEALAGMLISPLLLVTAGAVLRWLADFGDSRIEELADRLRDRQ
jgi:hypothetical protein